MLRNYILVLVRNMRKHWSYTLINIIGLATGIACFVLIALFVRDELTFDKFHEKGDRVFRMLSNVKNMEGTLQVPNALAGVLTERFPEVESVVRMDFAKKAIEYKEEVIYEQGFYYADPSLFDVFDFDLAQGNPKTALDAPNKIVLSEEMAEKYFPDQSPMGNVLRFSNDSTSYQVTGVLSPIPQNSRFNFSFITPFSGLPDARSGRDQWETLDATYYVLFKNENQDIEAFSDKVVSVYKEQELVYLPLIESFEGLYLNSDYSFTPSNVNGERKTIVTFSIIGVLILVLACINYVNLTTAKMTVRAGEIGVRKVFGAGRRDIRIQFLCETMAYVLLAVIISSGLVEYFLPHINELTNKQITLNYWSDPWILPFLIFLVPFIAFLAGFYPSMILSVLKPVLVLKSNTTVGGKMLLRKALVTFQFAITLMLIISTIIMNNQFRHFMDFKGGIDKEHLVRVGSGSMVREKFDLLKNEFERIPGVVDVIGGPFGSLGGLFPLRSENIEGGSTYINFLAVSTNYPEVMGLKLKEGRNFLPDSESDFLNSVLINEALAKELGWENPVGMKVETVTDNFKISERTVIGVLEDFSYNAKRLPDKLVVQPSKRFYQMSAKLQGTNLNETMAAIQQGWEEINPGVPFESQFLDEHIQNFYERESKFSTLFNAFSTLAILIAILGLVGLSAYNTSKRAKEIGVRKVLGASFMDIIKILSKGYIGLVILAFLIAVPISYFFVDNWMKDFANRISIGVSHYALGVIISLLVVSISIGYQSIKAARINPVNLLRNE